MSAVIPVSTTVPRVAHGGPPPREPRMRAASIGLWVFMGVAPSLVLLCAWAYVKRMSEGDASDVGRAPICPSCGVTALPAETSNVLDSGFVCENPDCDAFGDAVES